MKYWFTLFFIFMIFPFFSAPLNAGTPEPGNSSEKITLLRNELSQLKETIGKMQKVIEAQQSILEKLQNEKGSKTASEENKIAEPSKGKEGSQNVVTNDGENTENTGQVQTASSEAQKSMDIPRMIQSFNPDISVIGDVTGHMSNKGAGKKNENRFSLREVEVAFSSAIDPYARGDFFLSIGENKDGSFSTGVEEGYITFLTLPYDLQAKVGKFKADFGKANTYHTHARPWVENPIVINNFFGEEQMSEPGVSLSYLVPNPWDKYIELTLEAFNNGNEKSFAGSKSNDLVYLSHLKNFFDISESQTFELGLSAATGTNDSGHGRGRTNIEGIDLTYKWKPLREGLYKSLTWQTEFLASQNNNRERIEEDSLGMYSSLQCQFERRWTAGLRYDYSQYPHDSSKHDTGYSANLTFAQSEFAFLRLEYQHNVRNYGKDYDAVFLQLDFGIGPHRGHKY